MTGVREVVDISSDEENLRKEADDSISFEAVEKWLVV